MPDLSALIERLEKASGELDIDTLGQVICAGCGVEFRRATRGMGDDGSEELSVYAKDQQFEVWGDYRSRAPDVSIDAAVAFAERVLPGHRVVITMLESEQGAGPFWRTSVVPSRADPRFYDLPETWFHGYAKSAPIAIMIATLRALMGKEGED